MGKQADRLKQQYKPLVKMVEDIKNHGIRADTIPSVIMHGPGGDTPGLKTGGEIMEWLGEQNLTIVPAEYFPNIDMNMRERAGMVLESLRSKDT